MNSTEISGICTNEVCRTNTYMVEPVKEQYFTRTFSLILKANKHILFMSTIDNFINVFLMTALNIYRESVR